MKKLHTLRSMTLLFMTLTAGGFASTVRPSYPTHLFYTPTAYLNDDYDLVVSLHEVSYTLPQKLQIHMSFVDNIGRNCLGVRWGFMDQVVGGAGIAYSITSFEPGGHGIRQGDHSRLGLFLTWGFAHTRTFDAAVTPHMQLGYHISVGADLGLQKTPNEIFTLIGEIGSSYDANDRLFYLNLDGGLRLHPPKIPFLNFDLGVDFTESPLESFAKNVNPYIDIIFTMKTN